MDERAFLNRQLLGLPRKGLTFVFAQIGQKFRAAQHRTTGLPSLYFRRKTKGRHFLGQLVRKF
jgi:hypothetical protein